MKIAQAEIRNNAIRFAHDWKHEKSERAEAQTFWTELFAVFGIHRRSVASFEEKVKNLDGAYSRIDVFYSGVMIGEHKSQGQDLTKAQSQAFEYVQDLTRNGRGSEVPQYIVLSDFRRIVVFDLDRADPATPVADFLTEKLHENTRHLAFLAGQISRPIDPEDPINIKAVKVLGDLHDALEADGFTGHALERFLVRILFMLFADDTGIFEQDAFKLIVKESRSDGFGLGAIIEQFFQILDTPKDKRPQSTPDEFKDLPYVNGQLFSEHLPVVNFNAQTRDALLRACDFNWSRISPAVFGSLFQSIMASDDGKKKRRQIGAHYTSERDIMKLIRSLFLDELEAELEKTTTKPKLLAFQDKLASLKLLDPACGCGNFLVVAYRELRQLEIETLIKFHEKKKGEVQQLLNLDELLKVNVDQMHGIEIEEWPARIAEVAMWLIDHQMNTKAGEIFGVPVLRLPLVKSAKIEHANALRIDWNTVLPASECSYVLGNPPFIGHQYRNDGQQEDMDLVWDGVHKQYGRLDYVMCWYQKAAQYMRGDTEGAFVSTNSVSQGEQARILAACLFGPVLRINFAHRTFSWTSEARGKAHVHVVIIGFALSDRQQKHLVSYDESDAKDGVSSLAKNINAYLIDGPDIVLDSRSKPIDSRIPRMHKGSQPTDGGFLILDDEEKSDLVASEPDSAKWVRQYIGGREFINRETRWCLWLKGITSGELKKMPMVRSRVQSVKESRMRSPTKSVRDAAETPTLFTQDRQPESKFLAIPEVSSSVREYIPIGFLDHSVVASNKIQIVPSVSLYHFGVVTSRMYMSWVRTVGGRLKSDYSVSPAVLHNLPWPQDPSNKQKAAVESAAQGVLDAREQYPDQTLADLYDPLAMPKPLRDAHRALDRAVDKCYRSQPFTTERARVEFLFELYQKLTEPLTATKKKTRGKRKSK